MKSKEELRLEQAVDAARGLVRPKKDGGSYAEIGNYIDHEVEYIEDKEVIITIYTGSGNYVYKCKRMRPIPTIFNESELNER
jgi:hypothetical protein